MIHQYQVILRIPISHQDKRKHCQTPKTLLPKATNVSPKNSTSNAAIAAKVVADIARTDSIKKQAMSKNNGAFPCGSGFRTRFFCAVTTPQKRAQTIAQSLTRSCINQKNLLNLATQLLSNSRK